jgi:hypothetical protein
MRRWREELRGAHRLRYVLLPCSCPETARRNPMTCLRSCPSRFSCAFSFSLSYLASSSSSSPGMPSQLQLILSIAMNADGSDANCQERCCQQSCGEMGVTCPPGWQTSDWDRPEWSSGANWPESSCCYLTCAAGFDGLTCPAGKEARPVHDGHPCMRYGSGGVTDSASATCTAEECCQVTCASANAASCPTGQRLNSHSCGWPTPWPCEDVSYCCEDIPTIETLCMASSAEAGQFCWGPGGFAGSCPDGYRSRDEGDCHRAHTGVATESDCCYRDCGEIDGLTCPADETLKEHHRCYGGQCEEECCALTCTLG